MISSSDSNYILLRNDQAARRAYWKLSAVLKSVSKKHLEGSANNYLDAQIKDAGVELASVIKLNWTERVKSPVFSPPSSIGDCMTMGDWVECVKSGGFIDYDGYGELANENSVSNIEVSPSDITAFNLTMPDWATHVIWYNR